ncbi:uncharacterized protein LOC128921817 [Zeugodacus cucurbitae]|uniref:uncharacterized protein LOC128921817 n=1 Tax=Zeugodacus cucurbitae TaxID=28588 RepID=UPI0023D968FA|nr:uncharacterized protein LOC128921817 [Zeugodacus cucurbitae]
MGSIGRARLTGFLCRLCTEMSRVVIHIYGDHGRRINLERKILKYQPVFVSPTDLLPKAICLQCVGRVERNYKLLKRLKHANGILIKLGKSPVGHQDSDEYSSEEDDIADDLKDLLKDL